MGQCRICLGDKMMAGLNDFYLGKVEGVDFNEGIGTMEDLQELNDLVGKALR